MLLRREVDAANAALRGHAGDAARRAEAVERSAMLHRENAALREVAESQRHALGLAASEAQFERERVAALAQTQEREAAALREQQVRLNLESESQFSGVSHE
eukprot:11184187-Alexandrium_andersonii.AAC.1